MINAVKISLFRNEKIKILSIVKIHQESLKDNVLTNFGESFLIRVYNNIIIEKNNTLVIAKYKNKIVGYIALNFYKQNFIKSVRPLDIIIFLKNSILKPYLILSIYCQLMHKKNYPDDNSCEISHFAVLKKYRGIGIGNKLILESIRYAKSKNKYFLKTKTNNYNLSKFYTKYYNAIIIEKFTYFKQKFLFYYFND
jgi:ribosomal protein S18 acetylase RimI-like enzyme